MITMGVGFLSFIVFASEVEDSNLKIAFNLYAYDAITMDAVADHAIHLSRISDVELHDYYYEIADVTNTTTTATTHKLFKY